MSPDDRRPGVDRTKAWLMVGTFLLIVVLVAAGVAQRNMNLTSVALALVGYLGILTRSLLGGKDDEDDT